MKLYRLYHCFILIMLCISCGGRDKKSLERQREEIQVKAQQLLIREQELELREQDVLKQQRQIDSLKTGSDTIGVYDPNLIGTWIVTMQCTETTCEGSAIGDTKTEQWNISYENNKIVARATANKQLIRTYTGLFKENTLRLTATQTPNPETHMDVVLTPHQSTVGLMEGQRIINQGGKCRIVYALKAEKL